MVFEFSVSGNHVYISALCLPLNAVEKMVRLPTDHHSGYAPTFKGPKNVLYQGDLTRNPHIGQCTLTDFSRDISRSVSG